MLDIIGCDNLTSLPEEIHHLSALEHLRVKDCEGLRNSDSVKLLGSLMSLSILEVRNSFDPASLLDAVASLRKLQQLALMDFPDLEQRCERENGPYWPKISHVPYIVINRRVRSIGSTTAWWISVFDSVTLDQAHKKNWRVHLMG
ncbi:hypothetical protein QQ045_003111 [Rhodiola kirilowii]